MVVYQKCQDQMLEGVVKDKNYRLSEPSNLLGELRVVAEIPLDSQISVFDYLWQCFSSLIILPFVMMHT